MEIKSFEGKKKLNWDITICFDLFFVFWFYILRGTVDDAPVKYTEEEKSRKKTRIKT